MSHAWNQLPERGTPAMLRTIRWIGLRMGRPAGRLLLYPITLYFLIRGSGPRRASRAYLRQVLGREPGWWQVFHHIHTFAATILDRLYFLSGQFHRFDITFHHKEIFLEQARSGRGCILLGSHLGSFEVLRGLGVVEQSFKLRILMKATHNANLMRVLDALNPALSATVIPVSGPETLLRVRESLDEGYMVGTLGDRVATGDRRLRLAFLGREAAFPTGPATLAVVSGCPVILFFGLYRGGNRYDIYFERLAESTDPHRDRRDAQIRELTLRYARRLEHHARHHPYNWFNFYDFWEQD